jgi:hypothetical protein
VPNVTSIDLGIDGSGSMLGFTDSAETSDSWKSLIQGVTLASASQGLTVNPQRVGGGQLKSFDNPSQAVNPCFFIGCGAFSPVASSLDSLWKEPGLTDERVPLRVLISDLEVNDGDISKVIEVIKPHAEAGAVIGVLALKLPFEGNVYNSRGAVIYQGDATRPIYILASGPQSQVGPLLESIKSNISLSGVSTLSMKLTYLEEWANRETLTIRSVSGIPANQLSSGIPIRLGDVTYSPAATGEYQFAKLQKDLTSMLLSSSTTIDSEAIHPYVNIGTIEAISLPGFFANLNRVSSGGIAINGSDLQIKINTSSVADAKALRAVIPRGQLPEDWWIQWDRFPKDDGLPQDQTDGLLQLMTQLGKLFVAKGTTPAASFCVLTST